MRVIGIYYEVLVEDDVIDEDIADAGWRAIVTQPDVIEIDASEITPLGEFVA